MWFKRCMFSLCFILLSSLTCRQPNGFLPDDRLLVAFYNLDNLFDTIDDQDHNDKDFTKNGLYQWTPERYEKKLLNLALVISGISGDKFPDVLGVCELESAMAFNDLLAQEPLKNRYRFVHFDSPDERGIDVALAYNKNKFRIIDSVSFRVKLSKDSNDRTRDILWVSAVCIKTKDSIQFIVCHFPSRREGKAESEQNRLDAAQVCRKIVDEKCRNGKKNLVIMGDFNDEPWDYSLMHVLGAADPSKGSKPELFNLMWEFKGRGEGSYLFKGQWEIIDQFIISKALMGGKSIKYEKNSAGIKKEDWMLQKGKYEGYPLRTFGGIKWLNGYSDHLPVYMTISLNKNGE